MGNMQKENPSCARHCSVRRSISRDEKLLKDKNKESQRSNSEGS